MGEQTLSIIRITPEVAKEMLSRNYENNRRINKPWVIELSEIIKNGEWQSKMLDSPITFDAEGRLINGQHRLHAVIESNTPIETYVVKNASNTFYEYFDNGKKRSVSDFLSGQYASGRTAIVSFITCIDDARCKCLGDALVGKICHVKKEALKPTRETILNVERKYSEEIFEIAAVSAKIYANGKMLSAKAVGCFLWVYRGAKDIHDFAELLTENVDSSNHLISDMYKLLWKRKVNGQAQLDIRKQFLLLCYCYENYKKNIQMKKILTESTFEKLDKKYSKIVFKEA